MKGFFRHLFHIYAGEEKNASLFALLGFLWALGVTLGLKFADALFLLHVGADSLPVVYAFTACIMIVLAAFLLKAFHVVSADRIFITILSAGALFYSLVFLSFKIGLGIESKAIWFALRIFGSLFFSLVMTSYWTFVDQYYHHQDAKRLFTLFTSAIFLGVAVTGLIMRSSLIDFPHLTLGIIALLLSTAFGVVKISRQVAPVYDESSAENSGEQEESTYRFLFKSIITSKFTLLLMAGNFLTYLLLVITEYSYLSAFDDYFDRGIRIETGQEQDASLTLFLGQCLTGVSVFNLIVGLFLYSRFVRRFGINNLVLFTPAVLVLNFAGWSINNVLIFPVIGFFVVEGMLYIIDDNNFTLLLNAVPQKLKYKIRLIIESFFEPVGMLISSLLIAFLPIDSKIIGLFLSLCALGVGLLLRRQYLKAIFINMSESAIHFQRTIRDWFNTMSSKKVLEAERKLFSVFQKGDEQSQKFALEALLGSNDPSILEKLLQLSNQFDIPIKIKLLSMLSQSRFARDPKVIAKLQTWSGKQNDPKLASAVHFYLAQQGLLDPIEAAQDLGSSDLMLQGAAILALSKSWEHLPESVQIQNMEDANQRLQEVLDSQDLEKICMGITLLGLRQKEGDLNRLLPFLNHPSLFVVHYAAAAIERIVTPHDTEHAPKLIEKLSMTNDPELRQSYLQAIGKIGDPQYAKAIITYSTHFRPNERRLAENIIASMGKKTVPTLFAIVQDSAFHDRCRILAGRVLGRVALPQLRSHLYDVIHSEIVRAYFYFYHYHSIPAQYPQHDLTLLKDDLLSSYHSVLDFIIQLLGVSGEVEDCELLSRSLRSPNPKVRSHVIETLEKTCEPRIFRALYPLIADVPHQEKMEGYVQSGGSSLGLEELLDTMIHSSIYGDQIVAIALKYRLNLPNWRESLKEQLATREELLHHFAYELLER